MKTLAVICNSYPDSRNKWIKEIRTLNEREHLAATRAITNVAGLVANQPLLLLERNRLRLRSVSAFYRNSIALRRRSAQFGARSAFQNLLYDILNWLTANRLFIDHHEALFKSDYGEDSHEYQRLKAAVKLEYDGNRAYRVLHNLRDYMQHREFPAASVTITATSPELDDWSAIVEFVVERDSLLSSGFNWKAKPRRDLGDMPENIDILGLIEEASPCFRRVFAEITRVRLEGARDSVAHLASLVEQCRLEEGVPHIVGFEKDPAGNLVPATLLPIPVGILEWSRDPDAQDEYFRRLVDARLDIIEMSAPDGLDPKIRDSLRLGAALLNTYYESGGINPTFSGRVNAIANDLNDISPIIDGLTTTAAVALSMAASTLGTDARDLLGGMT